MSKYTESDIEYQNRPPVLKSAPWLDMPALRKACQEALLNAIASDDAWDHLRPEFVADVKEFCSGDRRCIPRVPRCSVIVDDVIFNEYPVSRRDSNLRRSRDFIRKYLMQESLWNMTRRGADE